MLHIAVSGNIGSGKTTLTELLAKQLNLNAIYENIDNNPYIISFYNDMKRWSFNLQIYFLCSRFKQTMEIQKTNYEWSKIVQSTKMLIFLL